MQEDASFDTEALDKELVQDAKRRRRKAVLNRMSRELRVEKLWAMLVQLLGPRRCAKCSSSFDVEVDHPDGRTWEARRLDYESRLRRYIQEFREGVRLRWLCSRCNGHDGWKRSQRNRKRRR